MKFVILYEADSNSLKIIPMTREVTVVSYLLGSGACRFT